MDKQERRKNMMMTDPISKVIPKMAIPTIVAFLINSIYSLADTYFVSSLGTNATAAVSVNGSLDQIILMTGSLLALGANSFVARLLGAKKEQEANEVLSTAWFIALGFGTILMILGLTFMTPMVRMLGATPTCEQYSIDYAKYVLLAAPFMATSFVMNQCLRAEGSALLSMIGMGFGGILNCFLDPIFIFDLGMGVAGASLATAISKLVSFGILIFPYLTKRSLLRLSIRNFRLNWGMLAEIARIGSSSMFRSALAVISAIIVNNLAGNMSDAVLAGIGVTNKVMMFPFGIVLGFGSGFQPVAGFNWGAGRYDRVRESYRFSSRMAFIGAAILGALICLFAEPLIGVFSETDAEMLKIGALCIRLQAIALPLHAWGAVVNMFCAGLGYAKGALLLSTARQGTCFLPIIYPLTHFFGVYGLIAAQSIADILTLGLAIPLILLVLRRVDEAEQQANVHTCN